MTEWVYLDSGGEPRLKVVRKDSARGKRIHQERFAGPDGWVRGGIEGKRPLYGLPELVGDQGRRVVVVEGEKCVDAIRAGGPTDALITTWPGGSAAWKKADWSVLRDRPVDLIADADDAGRKCMTAIAGVLAGQGCAVRLALPEGTDGADVADWLAEDTREAFARVRSLLQPFEPPPPAPAAAKATAPAPVVDLIGVEDWQDGNAHFTVLGTDQDRACFRLAVGGRPYVFAPQAVRLASPASLIRMAPRSWWLARTGGDKLTTEAAQQLGDALIRAADRRGPWEADPDPSLAGLPDGRIVDLRTGTIRDVDRDADRYVLGSLGAVPDDSPPKVWLASLDEMFAGDGELIGWLQRWMGYCLTGHVREHKFLLLHGPSGTGKSTVQSVIEGCAGTYFRGLSKRGMFGEHGDHAEHLARLQGARLAIADDVPAHGWRNADIKSLVSGETITARGMAEASRDFTSRVKIVMSCNALPEISDVGITSRIQPIEMAVPLRESDRHRRYQILDELPRILHWAVRGAVVWHQEGLGTAGSIDRAVESFRQVGDRIGAWLEDCCELDAEYQASSAELLKSCNDHMHETGRGRVSAKDMAAYFRHRRDDPRIEPARVRGGSSRGYGGIRVRFGGPAAS